MKTKRIFKYSRPVEQMGIALVYGGLPEVYKMMDDNELELAIKEIKKSGLPDNQWDLKHYPKKSGLGGKFVLITW